jgi:hypothetical protein
MITRFVAAIFSILACVSGWLIQATPADAQDSLRLWSTSYKSSSACRSHSAPVGAEKMSKSIQGHKWPHTSGMGIEYIDRNAKHLNAAALGRANDSAFAARLLTAARSGAFTKLDFEGAGGSSPSFVSAIVVESTAYAVSYLRSRNALSGSDLKEINAWVQKLMKNSKQRAGSQDHKAAVASSQLMWAAAVGNVSEFKKARRALSSVFNKLKRNPYFVADLRNNNEVMHHMVHAGMVLRLNGLDVFNAKFGKHTFNDAIAYHAQQVQNNGSKQVTTKGDPTDQARSIMRSQGWGTHLAWIPVYLSAQPSGTAAPAVKALNSYLRRTDRKPYWGIQMGVHTGCLYGR